MENPLILFENDEFVLINKPSGWYSIPAREPKSTDRVLTEWIRHEHKTEAWVLHRLDRFTSGVICFAKSAQAHQKGNHWFLNRKIKKTYQFLAAPPPRLPAIQIREPVENKPAQTLFEVLKKTDSVFWGKATPVTGRFHQIRFHAAHGGFPLLGDEKYGGLKTIIESGELITFSRFCLHAFELELPFGTFQAPLAEDLVELKKKLKL